MKHLNAFDLNQISKSHDLNQAFNQMIVEIPEMIEISEIVDIYELVDPFYILDISDKVAISEILE